MKDMPLFNPENQVEISKCRNYRYFIHPTLGECIKLPEYFVAVLHKNGTKIKDIVKLSPKDLVMAIPKPNYCYEHQYVNKMLLEYIFVLERSK